MSGLSDLRPGDLGFTTISGGAGVLVAIGQALLAAASWEERHLRHCFVVTEGGAHPRIVQAMPGGAEEVEIGAEHWTKDFAYLRPRYGPLQDLQVADMARRYVGTPYSFLDYAALLELHTGIPNGCARRRVTSSKHMICSQLVDQALSDAGVHVFNDGRLSQDVMPVELHRALAAMPGTQVIKGG